MSVLQHDASGGEFLLNRLTVLHRFTVLEGNPLQQQFNSIRSPNPAPTFFSFLDQLERQSQEELSLP